MEVVKDEVDDWYDQNERDQVGTHGPAGTPQQSLLIQPLERLTWHMSPELSYREISEAQKNDHA